MSVIDTTQMGYKQLRLKVAELEDTIAKIKRQFEDLYYNIDTENLSESFVREIDGMRSQIKISAEKIESTVSYNDLEGRLSKYSTLSQTADAITATVNAEYVDDLIGDTYVTNLTFNSVIEQTAESIKMTVSETYQTKTDAETGYTSLSSEISQSANNILLTVSGSYQTQADADAAYNNLESKITLNESSISAIVEGQHTGDLLDKYFTGIEISPNSIKMKDNAVYSEYNSAGLRFYDASEQKEGWALEPNTSCGGMLSYYVNDASRFCFGSEITPTAGAGYSNTDMVIKAISGGRGRFVVDLSDSGNREVKFAGLNNYYGDTNAPVIYANGMLLATQDWVSANFTNGGTTTVVFG